MKASSLSVFIANNRPRSCRLNKCGNHPRIGESAPASAASTLLAPSALCMRVILMRTTLLHLWCTDSNSSIAAAGNSARGRRFYLPRAGATSAEMPGGVEGLRSSGRLAAVHFAALTEAAEMNLRLRLPAGDSSGRRLSTAGNRGRIDRAKYLASSATRTVERRGLEIDGHHMNKAWRHNHIALCG